MRQVIESVNATFKGQLDLALTAAIWHNDNLNLSVRRSLTAYDH